MFKHYTLPAIAPNVEGAIWGLAASMSAVLAAWVTNFPAPAQHDEFAYLFLAECLNEGRFAFPSPPLAEYFQTFHILVEPVFASKFLPGQALMLLTGLWFGHPAFGVWIVLGGFVAGVFHLVHLISSRAFARWSAGYGLAAFGLFSYHSQSFWGGLLSACCATWALWAVLRAQRTDRPPTRVETSVLTLACLLLAMTRPLEGFFACLVPGFLWIRSLRGISLPHLVPHVLIVLIGTGLLVLIVGKQNIEVTGDPLKFPYAEYMKKRHPGTPHFIWQKEGPVRDYDSDTFRRFEIHQHRNLDALDRPVFNALMDWANFFSLAFPLLLIYPLLALWKRDHEWPVIALSGAGLVLFVNALTVFNYPHYFMVAAPFFFMLQVDALRRWPAGCLRRVILTLLPLLLAITPLIQRFGNPEVRWELAFKSQRSAVTVTLEDFPGPDLILVQQGPGYSPYFDWIYNHPDPANAEIIWMRDLENQAQDNIQKAFPNRTYWTLHLHGPGSFKLERLP